MNGANPADGIIRNLPMEKINFSSDGNMDIEKRAKTHGDRNELPPYRNTLFGIMREHHHMKAPARIMNKRSKHRKASRRIVIRLPFF
jgi:hypothetical protein